MTDARVIDSTVSAPMQRSGLTAARRILLEPWLYFALALCVTVAGFWPSFFSRLPSMPGAHLIHGSSATAWMAVPVAQAWLIRRGKVKLHRTLGRFSLLLAPVVVLGGLRVVQIMALKNLDQFRLYRVKFVFLDLTVLMLFSAFVALAIWSARKGDIGNHKRYMAGTALLALEPALERLLMTLFPTMITNFDQALYAALLSVEVIIAGLIVVEWRTARIRAPFPFLLAYFVAIHVLATPVALNSKFQRFAMWFAEL